MNRTTHAGLIFLINAALWTGATHDRTGGVEGLCLNMEGTCSGLHRLQLLLRPGNYLYVHAESGYWDTSIFFSFFISPNWKSMGRSHFCTYCFNWYSFSHCNIWNITIKKATVSQVTVYKLYIQKKCKKWTINKSKGAKSFNSSNTLAFLKQMFVFSMDHSKAAQLIVKR